VLTPIAAAGLDLMIGATSTTVARWGRPRLMPL